MVISSFGTLIVFAKRPRLGHVKTRLQREVGVSNAAKIYSLLLRKTLATSEKVTSLCRVIMPADLSDVAWFMSRYSARGWHVRGQRGETLGKRMEEALIEVGDPRLPKILIGSDIVNFRSNDLLEALSKLGLPGSIVLGPAVDGGYWLIGTNGLLPDIFGDMGWGSSSVFGNTITSLDRQRIDYDLVGQRQDIDRPSDLRRTNGWLRRKLNRLRCLGVPRITNFW